MNQQLTATAAGREAKRIITKLRDAGFEAVLAGGCVRDAMLGRLPKDFDVATDATPHAVRQVFGRESTLAFGESFGVIGVLPNPSQRNAEDAIVEPTEVATFRADGTYSDGRRPDDVTYGDAQADAQRRDFTINGMFYDPIDGKLIDFVGGQRDLREGRLRTIGEPRRRFDEDKLRMLRAIRFATTLGFEIDVATASAIVQHAHSIGVVSGERIGAEMRRVLVNRRAGDGLRLLVSLGLHQHVWPELTLPDVESIHGKLGRLNDWCFEVAVAVTAHVVATRMGDPPSAVTLSRSRLRQWRRSTAEMRAVETSLRHFDTVAQCEHAPWSTLQPLLIDRDVRVTLDVAQALAGPTAGVQRARRERERSPETLDPPPLLTGDDLIRLGYRPSADFKRWLADARAWQLDGKVSTQRDILNRLQLDHPAANNFHERD